MSCSLIRRKSLWGEGGTSSGADTRGKVTAIGVRGLILVENSMMNQGITLLHTD
jgi:hypothetical protein